MILEDAVKQFALPTMTCPVTGDLRSQQDDTGVPNVAATKYY